MARLGLICFGLSVVCGLRSLSYQKQTIPQYEKYGRWTPNIFVSVDTQLPRLESLPCAADLSAAHFKFQPWFQPRNFRKTTKGNNRTIVLRHKYSRASNFDAGEIRRAFCKLSNLAVDWSHIYDDKNWTEHCVLHVWYFLTLSPL